MDSSMPAQAVSPPFGDAGDPEYNCYVDSGGILYQIRWTGSMQQPELSTFPTVDAVVEPVIMSMEMAQAWYESTVIDYGSDSCVKGFLDEPFPIIKLAHPNRQARARLQYEFDILGQMTKYDLPVPRVDPNPLCDDTGVFGYRLEALTKIIPADAMLCTEVEGLLRQLHNCGFSHGDLSPSNIMRNREGRLVLIDFSFSGILGTKIPDHIPRWVYQNDTFHVRADEERLKTFF